MDNCNILSDKYHQVIFGQVYEFVVIIYNLNNKIFLKVLIVFLEKAIDSAVLYKDHAKRHVIHKKDVILALMREVFTFGTHDDIESQVECTKEELLAMSDTSESEFDFDEVSIESTTSGESEEIDFEYSTCTCILCVEMNTVEEKWKNWSPQTPLEKTLHRAIELTRNAHL